MLPLKGQRGLKMLETAGQYWQGDNRILIVPPTGELGDANAPIERMAYPDESV